MHSEGRATGPLFEIHPAPGFRAAWYRASSLRRDRQFIWCRDQAVGQPHCGGFLA
jgi:hypothetical protein